MTTTRLKDDGAALTIYHDGPHWDGQPTATLGDISSNSAQALAALLDRAIAQIRAAGCRRIIGPMSGDTWHSYRFVSQTDDSPAFLLEPKNKPHEPQVFAAAGFTPISRYFSARVDLAQAAQRTPPPTDAFTTEPWDGTQPETLFKQVYALSVAAFSNNAFYKPIAEEDFLAMYRPIVPMIKKDLVFFTRRPDGSLAGFLFGIPNYAEGPGCRTAILKTYASLERGAGQHLAHAFHTAAQRLGYDRAIHALIHDDNQSAARSAAEGADVFRRYELLGLTLDG